MWVTLKVDILMPRFKIWFKAGSKVFVQKGVGFLDGVYFDIGWDEFIH